jgi:hypothetical protein
MTHITMADLKEYARKGRVSQAEVDRIIESQQRGRKALLASADAAIAAMPRLVLLEPVEFIVPLELLTENRLRAMQPKARGRHVKAQRAVVRNAWALHFRKVIPALPVTVTFTRFGRHMDAHDSLAAAFKHVTDEVTEMLGLHNDDTKEVTWKYDQEPRGSEPMRIRIRVQSRQS